MGDRVRGGDIMGAVEESPLVTHSVMVPPGQDGILTSLLGSQCVTADDTIYEITTEKGELICHTLFSTWPIRRVRPITQQDTQSDKPFETGLRVIDTLFPYGISRSFPS